MDNAQAIYREAGSVALTNIPVKKTRTAWKEECDPYTHRYMIGALPAWTTDIVKLTERVTGLKVINKELRKFREGDYTVIYDAMETGKGAIALLDLEDSNAYCSFIKHDQELIRAPARKNTLFIVNNTGLKHFFKYLNHRQQPRTVLYLELQ